jgi:hypothetical protein
MAALLFRAGHVSLRAIIPKRACMAMILRLTLRMALLSFGMQGLLSLDLWALRMLGRRLAEETTGWFVAAVNVAKVPAVLSFVMMGMLIHVGLSLHMGKLVQLLLPCWGRRRGLSPPSDPCPRGLRETHPRSA